MLGWMSGQNNQVADDSKVLEPPETPAPVFALRAFQSALFGTPKADDEDNTSTQLKPKKVISDGQLDRQLTKKSSTEHSGGDAKNTKADVGLAASAMASPTKSILVTPGTASNRRKTVSFGDSVVDNERKRDGTSNEPMKTPSTVSGNISSQWTSSSSEGKRSKLTQALMDSREKPSRAPEKSMQKSDESRASGANSKPAVPPAQTDENEDTVNMNEPRSQSGKYWKAEFDSYRTKTALEIKRLIQYRSAAKTYAKKKDEEASRLAAKLKEEELKVAEMERHVTQLASTMVAENSRADKEQLVRDLTKQTALALQYKHKVSLLRKVLEQHGVVGSEVDDIAGQSEIGAPSRETPQVLREAQQSLAEANAKIEEMKQQQSEFEKLKDLALSSEEKALKLEKENNMLKHTLARVKKETSQYEGRRKEREAKLKQREAKLETRVQEYRERLKAVSQRHRTQEEDLKESFNEERRHMQEQIDLLRTKVRAFESATEIRARARHSDSYKGYPEIQVHSPQKENSDETEETTQPPSPSPRSKNRRALGLDNDLADPELRRAMKEMGIEDIDEKFNTSNLSPLKMYKPRYAEDEEIVPPSSPPEIPSIETGTWSGAGRRTLATASLPSRRLHLDDSHQIRSDRLRSRRSATKYSLDALSTLPDAYLLNRARRQTLTTTTKPSSLSVERKIAAQARLKRKDESRRGRDEGKENIRTSIKT